MSDFHRPETHPVARKDHQCIGCYATIPKGERYVRRSGFYDGGTYNNAFHNECEQALAEMAKESGDNEFMPGECDPPARLKDQSQ